MSTRKHDSIATDDGVDIHYVEAGEGEIIVLVPGFSQSAAQFKKQVDGLSTSYRVLAVDHRGHGESGKPDHGYRISRLAADLRALLLALDIGDVTLLGHSLGCTVIWSYWDLYGSDRIKRLILADQGPIGVKELAPNARAEQRGAMFTFEEALGIAAGLRSDQALETSRAVVDMLHTPELSDEDAEWILHQNLLLPREHAATLHLDYCGNDWRDVLPRITVPTLVIGGAASVISPDVAEGIAEQIPDSVVRIFSAAEKGSHLMFWENAELFNSVVSSFIETGRVT
ncbi:alpha/beta fold hydrolase [Streptomyces sp. SBT349]|uniref:alpha/beta fold hydrolase n=1 Tax=Streptomyces sp. SBT349 TaxID=1580539 RepID=UPI00066B68E7|nr:alpha/beta hydrolase [Streptomyces sp. SBT349]